MDPDIALRNLLELAKKCIADYEDPNSNGIDQDEANDLAMGVLDLHQWIEKGGFLPEAWRK